MPNAQSTASFFSKDAVGRWGGQIRLVPNPLLIETINYAINAYGFLIQRNERVSPVEFSERIRAAYDCTDCPQNKAVVDALMHLV